MKNKNLLIPFVAALLIGAAYFSLNISQTGETTMTITSESFTNGSKIPVQFTCDGDNISPQLSWAPHPSAQSYVIIVDDPDALQVVGKTYVHWTVLIPADITSLPEAASGSSLDSRAVEITNDSGKAAYVGPCPPASSGEHTYRFTVFAMNGDVATIQKKLPTAPITAEAFNSTLSENILGSARMTGRYTRAG
jgi:hypothetical protein